MLSILLITAFTALEVIRQNQRDATFEVAMPSLVTDKAATISATEAAPTNNTTNEAAESTAAESQPLQLQSTRPSWLGPSFIVNYHE
ncbi:hypothetical protein JD969_11865 [Planctomycetota bacterium]|nr:hypothetical protein JD969_11865 [Planctomycetota bacterium]